MWTVGMMAWRIGAILDLRAQVEWIRQAGFGGVGLHACAGEPARWQGVDPSATDGEARRRLRKILSGFLLREVHAPVSCRLRADTLTATIEELARILSFAGDIGATVVTVHARIPDPEESGAPIWRETLEGLNAAAARQGVALGLEVTEGFDWIARQDLPNVGVTLDVGHMHHEGARPLRPFGSLGEVVRRCGAALKHLHLHDHNGAVDHVELGTGRVDFKDLLAALKDVGYQEALMLELNPDRCPPEGILRSRAWLQERIQELEL